MLSGIAQEFCTELQHSHQTILSEIQSSSQYTPVLALCPAQASVFEEGDKEAALPLNYSELKLRLISICTCPAL
jgi:hypothetical protein